MNKYNFDEWDVAVLSLAQSVSNISHNFYRIIIDKKENKWVLRFFVYSNDEATEEMIYDIGGYWYNLMEDNNTEISLDNILENEINIGIQKVDYYHKRAMSVICIDPDFYQIKKTL